LAQDEVHSLDMPRRSHFSDLQTGLQDEGFALGKHRGSCIVTGSG
jgi:hypothetical protein